MITNPPVEQPVLDKTNNGLFSMPWRVWLSQFNTVSTTFSTVTSVSGVAPVASTGGTTPSISMSPSSSITNGYLSSTDWTTFNSKQPAGTYVNTVSGTAPVVSSGGVTPAISMAAATGSVNGYLTSTDWTTFNNKVTSIIAGTGITVSGPTGNVTISQSATTTKQYGAFHDTSTVTATSTTTAYVMNLGSTDLSSGISIVGGTKVTVTTTGVYNLQFSAQLSNPNNAIVYVSIWIQLNGANIAASAGTNGVPAKHGSNNGLQIISWNYLLSLAASDYLEMYWQSDTTNVQLITFPATTGPAVPQSPALIVTITQV